MSEMKTIINASKTFEEKMLLRDAREKKVAFIMGGLGALLGLLGLIVVLMLLPLKQTEVELYTVDNATGRVEKITRVKEAAISASTAMAKAFAAHYVSMRERYNYFSLQNDYDRVQLFNTEAVNADYLALFDGEKAPNKLYQQAANLVTIDIISNVISHATAPNQLATLRFKKTLRKIADGHERVEYWFARLTFRYLPQKALTEEQRESNPLGFTVTSYQIDKERRGE